MKHTTINFVQWDGIEFNKLYIKLLVKLWISTDAQFAKFYLWDKKFENDISNMKKKDTFFIKLKLYQRMKDIFAEMWVDISTCLVIE